ncbi:Cysteinyl-tRNA synthetase [Pediococcus damnosus]|uniref:Cysteine--tRNA ligase n=1 Tax=Pediococcus damnosus TaxID=51663 RepID=A0A0R2HEG7_9LACO|nr:cysteine--tRNA ligase [Pediococcus damnosus]AMV60092.1 Cysteinyl-tRNA synthetase [Pediococcus damnosus]AMV62632.1 Cysteinyl-tRNA synthetase [Pediococcus damnosus]AMV64336.1 Cysteinyl-tRNA synthetase [Pediococcus damnosus]AMV67486.1 Cysteinyl-tRNA synthetase [Pediococcus damnosus]AMV69159.1 Cysteinyl-tRNA synthetase [Pediococcus damnosus]
MINLYNTMTRKKEPFQPITPGVVNMYVCGPTVYNYIHIGNARSIIAFDTVRRYFEYRGFKVNFVSNFTDVDDKMINTAKKEGTTVPKLAEKFIQAFMQDSKAINVEPATVNPRATQNVPEIVDFIQVLIDKGYAYASDGDVYYRTRKFANYGKLSGQNIDELEQGASEHINDEETARKEDPIDFALWKGAKADEISWDAPWGKGRPGWHIECSVMATKYLGDTIDIHAGGEDLEFPHHENEIAQSEAKTGKKFANYWMHNGFVTVGDENEKMSKSLGNFVTVHDIINEMDPQILRLFMATTQYRRPIQYTRENLEEAGNNLAKLQNAFANLNYRFQNSESGADAGTDKRVKELVEQFTTAMDDDFNVQNGIAVVYELAKVLNVYSEQATVKKETLELLKTTFVQLVSIFGIKLEEGQLEDETIKQLIVERDAARDNKDFKRSDEIRDQLKEQGINLEDTPQGTRWKRA